jgi:hypothetical protein
MNSSNGFKSNWKTNKKFERRHQRYLATTQFNYQQLNKLSKIMKSNLIMMAVSDFCNRQETLAC